jgi:hypothetical protein
MAAKKPASYGKMEKSAKDMAKDKAMGGMKEGSKKEMASDKGIMPKGKGMSVVVAVGMKKGKK